MRRVGDEVVCRCTNEEDVVTEIGREQFSDYPIGPKSTPRRTSRPRARRKLNHFASCLQLLLVVVIKIYKTMRGEYTRKSKGSRQFSDPPALNERATSADVGF